MSAVTDVNSKKHAKGTMIPTRIFLGFALLLLAFAAVAGFSLVQHAQTVRTLRLLHEGYLPLAVTLGEGKAIQAVLAAQITQTDADSLIMRKGWLKGVISLRPTTLRRAFHGLERTRQLAEDAGETELARVSNVDEHLGRIRDAYAHGVEDFEQLYDAIEHERSAEVAQVLERMHLNEQQVQRDYREAWVALQDAMTSTSAGISEQERRAVIILAVLAFLLLCVGMMITWWSWRVLQPLPLLHKRVAAVARGDFSQTVPVERDDELGQLVTEFEKMVQALGNRDARLKEAKARLIQSERLAAIGRMAAHVTHEVRNPLSSIGLNADLLEEEIVENVGGSDSPKAKEPLALLRAIRREIDRLTQTTEEYLRLARLPSPRLEPEELGVLARDTALFVKREMEAQGIDLVVEVQDALPLVAIDEPQIRQSLLNVLRNAKEAMPEGGQMHLRVYVESSGATQSVVLEVQDQGTGISTEAQAHIFDLFYTTKKRGTGLGLALTQQIIAAHHGSILCEPGLKRGTRFYIRLPVLTTSALPTPTLALTTPTLALPTPTLALPTKDSSHDNPP